MGLHVWIVQWEARRKGTEGIVMAGGRRLTTE